MQEITKFNIRIYTLIVNENLEILITDEFYLNFHITKFPGGGLEFGESTIQCLEREAIEEMGQEIEVLEHFYTTDFVQISRFHTNHQIICIYYFSKIKDKIKFKISETKHTFDESENGSIFFRWQKISELTTDDFTFESDKVVLTKLKQALNLDKN